MSTQRQASGGAGTRRLGDYLSCPAGAVEDALARPGAPPIHGRVGERLLTAGLITVPELESALQAQRVDRLRDCTVFMSLDQVDLDQLSSAFDEVSVKAGNDVLAQDSDDPFLYVLASGRLEVYRVDADDGEVITLATIEPGEPVGEMGLVSGGMNTASVRATEDSQLLRARYTDVTKRLENSVHLARAFWSVVTERLKRTNRRYQEDHIRRKVAERSLLHLREFLDLSEARAVGVGIDGLIERLVHTASSLMGAERATLFLLDQGTGELWSKVAEGAEVKEIRVRRGAGIVGWVAEHGEIQNIADAYDDERFNQAIDRKTGYRTRSILCGPVWSLRGEILGVVQIINKHDGRAFNSEDEDLFQAFAHQAAVAVENFLLYNRMVASHERMAILLDVANSVGGTLELPALIDRIVTKMPSALKCERSSFFVYDRDTEELWSMVAKGAELTEIRFPASSGLAGACATSGGVVNVLDAYDDPRFNSEFDRRSGFRTRSVLCLPVRSRSGEVIGVTQLMNKETGVFDDQDVELASAIAGQIGVAVENAKLHASVVGMKNYLESVQESISNSLLTLDTQRRVVTANRAAGTLLGSDTATLRGMELSELLAPLSGELVDLVERVYETRGSSVQYDITVAGVAAGEGAVNLNALPLEDSEGEFRGAVVIIEDITREKRVKSTLTRYMAKDIVERMLEDPRQQALGGIRSRATVLFSDIRDFTGIAEFLSAEGVMDLLNEYFTLMVDEVFGEQGVLDKFIGDAMMAVFGVPFARDDDAVRAVRAALGMLRVLESFNAARVAEGKSPISIGIGVNTDEVISGNMGSSKRMDYTVIGDGVNLASRIEGLNKQYGTRLLVSESTCEQVGDAFRMRLIDRVIAKGKSRPVAIYEVLGESDQPLSDSQQLFCEALRHYHERRFEEALELFRAGAGDDPACVAYLRRCERFLRTPPPDDWDGTWRAKSK